MQVAIHDRNALLAISPSALSAYARTAGWSQHKPYRRYSHLYIGDGLPEIAVPCTAHLGDYASVVAALIDTFAQVAGQDQLAVYRSLVTADRDVIRIRAATESNDGSLGLNDGANLINGSREMVLSAACSLQKLQPVYRAGANKEAAELLQEIRLGQTDQGSFVVTLLTPVVPPPIQPIQETLFDDQDDQDVPIARQMTRRLVEALGVVRQAVEQVASGNDSAFDEEVVRSGVSANLCEALVKITKPFPKLDIGVSWARTLPKETALSNVTSFGKMDVELLSAAARMLRECASKRDVYVRGFVSRLKREEEDIDGTITLKGKVDELQRIVSVVASLEQTDYEQVVQAHRDRALVVLKSDLERSGQRWRLLNPCLEYILRNDEPESDDD